MGLWKTDKRRFYPWASFAGFVSWFMISMYNYDFSLLKPISGDTGSAAGFANAFFFSGFAIGALTAILFIGDRYSRKVLLTTQVVWVILSLSLFLINGTVLFYFLDTFWGAACGVIIILLIYDAIFVTPYDKWVTYVVYTYLVMQAIIYLENLFPAGSYPILTTVVAVVLQIATLLLCINNKTDRLEIRMEIPPAQFSLRSAIVPLIILFLVYCSYSIIRNVINPAYALYDRDAAPIQFIPNYVTLLLFLFFGKKLKDSTFLAGGITLLGLAFILYLTAPRSLSSRIVLDFLIQPAYLFTDVFVYSYIGKMTYKYGKKKFSGRILLVTVFITTALSEPISTFIFNEIVKNNIQTSAMFFIIIIAVLLLLPKLEKILEHEFFGHLGDRTPLDIPDSAMETEKDYGYHKNSEEIYQELLLLLPENTTLTPREREVMFMVADGQDNDIISSQMGISRNTLKVHVKNILAKYGVANRKQLLALRIPPSQSLLTESEKAILRMLGEGKTREEIAKELFISPATAKVYIWRAKKKIEGN